MLQFSCCYCTCSFWKCSNICFSYIAFQGCAFPLNAIPRNMTIDTNAGSYSVENTKRITYRTIHPKLTFNCLKLKTFITCRITFIVFIIYHVSELNYLNIK